MANLFAEKCLPSGLRTLQKNITKRDVRKFVDIVILKWEHDSTRSDKLSTVSAILRYGMKVMDASETNPFEHAQALLPKPKKGSRKSETNKAYPREILSPMLGGLAKHCANGRSQPTRMVFPVSILALYTGMRLEEICRLKKDEDILIIDGVEIIRVSASKSIAGIREIPVNRGAKLAIEWLRSCNPEDEFLVPGLKEYDGRRSKKVSDMFGKWKSGYFKGVADHSRGYTFHSFRSTAITALDRAEVNNDYISLLVGHEDGRSTLAKKTYSAGRKIQSLVEPSAQMDYGDEVFGLCETLLGSYQ